MLRRNPQPPAFGHRVACIDRQVEDRHFELVGIDHHRIEPGGDDDRQLDLRAERGGQQPAQFVEQRCQRHAAHLEWLATGEGKQALDQHFGAFGRLQRAVDQAVLALAAHLATAQYIQPADDRAEQVVEIVCYPARQLPDRFQLLGLTQGLLRREQFVLAGALLGNVAPADIGEARLGGRVPDKLADLAVAGYNPGVGVDYPFSATAPDRSRQPRPVFGMEKPGERLADGLFGRVAGQFGNDRVDRDDPQPGIEHQQQVAAQPPHRVALARAFADLAFQRAVELFEPLLRVAPGGDVAQRSQGADEVALIVALHDPARGDPAHRPVGTLHPVFHRELALPHHALAERRDHRFAVGRVDRVHPLLERDVVAACHPQDLLCARRPGADPGPQIPVPGSNTRTLGSQAQALLGFAQLLVGQLAVGDVVDRADRALDPSARAAQADPARDHPAHHAIGPDHAIFDRKIAIGGESLVGLGDHLLDVLGVDRGGILFDRNFFVAGHPDDMAGLLRPVRALRDQIPFPHSGARTLGCQQQASFGFAQVMLGLARFGQIERHPDEPVVLTRRIERRLRYGVQPAPAAIDVAEPAFERERCESGFARDRFGGQAFDIVGMNDRTPIEPHRVFEAHANERSVGAVDEAALAIEPGQPHRDRRAIGDQPEFIRCGDVRDG